LGVLNWQECIRRSAWSKRSKSFALQYRNLSNARSILDQNLDKQLFLPLAQPQQTCLPRKYPRTELYAPYNKGGPMHIESVIEQLKRCVLPPWPSPWKLVWQQRHRDLSHEEFVALLSRTNTMPGRNGNSPLIAGQLQARAASSRTFL